MSAKPHRIALFLRLSLICNGVLLLLCFYPVQTPVAKNRASARIPAAVESESEARDKSGPPQPSLSPEMPWGDLAQMIPVLERLGLSPNASRLAVYGLMEAEYDVKRMNLRYPEGRNYWEVVSSQVLDQATTERVYREEQQALRDLFGPSWLSPEHQFRIDLLAHRLQGLVAVEKLGPLAAILSDYQEMRLSTARGAQEDAGFEQALTADLEALLTPEEIAAYQAWHSPVAVKMAEYLEETDLSTEEFVKAHRIVSRYVSGKTVGTDALLRDLVEAIGDKGGPVVQRLLAKGYIK